MIYNTGETSEELREKYNPDGSNLRIVQLRMLEMLSYLDTICKRNDIEWMISFGNVLGAVRHGGFIPWDDDIDIALDRVNYNKLCKVLKKTKHPEFVLQDHNSDHGHYCYYSVLRDLCSEYLQDDPHHKNKKYRGFQIDIFCLEEGVLKFPMKLMGKYAYLNMTYLAGRGFLDYLARIIFLIGKYILIPFCHLLSFIFGDKNYVSMQYGFQGTEYIKYDKQIIFPYKPIRFENKYFPGPAEPEKFCSCRYGNFMDLPPVNQRIGHNAKYIYSKKKNKTC